MFGWFRRRRRALPEVERSEWPPPEKVVAEFYNERRDFRGLVIMRFDDAFAYLFQSLMYDPVYPVPDDWRDDNLHPLSGVYDTIERAVAEAKRDAEWVRHA
jgi:hypothetical protein